MKRISALAAALVVLVLLLTGQALADGPLGGESLAASGPNVLAVWRDGTYGSEAICFRSSVDGGATWKPMKRLVISSYAYNPVIAVSAPYVYVAYELYDGSYPEIYVLKSPNRGATWEGPVRVSGVSTTSYDPSISASLSNIDVYWTEVTGSTDLVGHNHSGNFGQNWNGQEYIPDDLGLRFLPSAAAEGDTACVGWIESGTGWGFLRRTNTSIAIWIDTLEIRNNLSVDCSQDISGMIFTAPVGPFFQVFFSRVTTSGFVWSDPVRLSFLGNANLMGPVLRHSGASVYAAWEGGSGIIAPMSATISSPATPSPTPLSSRVYFARSTDAGLTWKPDKILSPAARNSSSPGLAADGSNVYVSWWDVVSSPTGIQKTLYVKRSTDKGFSWKAPKKIGSQFISF